MKIEKVGVHGRLIATESCDAQTVWPVAGFSARWHYTGLRMSPLIRSPRESRPIVAAFLYLKNVPSSSRELRVIQIFCYTKKLLRARYTQERHSIRVLKAVRRP